VRRKAPKTAREHNLSYHADTQHNACACYGAALEEEEEEEEEEGLFKADAVNEEDPERDRATQVRCRRTRMTSNTAILCILHAASTPPE
jgi:hypothetical protein